MSWGISDQHRSTVAYTVTAATACRKAEKTTITLVRSREGSNMTPDHFATGKNLNDE